VLDYWCIFVRRGVRGSFLGVSRAGLHPMGGAEGVRRSCGLLVYHAPATRSGVVEGVSTGLDGGSEGESEGPGGLGGDGAPAGGWVFGVCGVNGGLG